MHLHVSEGVARPTINALDLACEGRGIRVSVVVASLFHVVFVAVLTNLLTQKQTNKVSIISTDNTGIALII